MDLQNLVNKWDEFFRALQDEYRDMSNNPDCQVAMNYVDMMLTFPNFMAWLKRKNN